MISILLGAVALVLLLFLLYGFTGSDPKLLAKLMRYGAVGALAAAALFFAYLDRVGMAMLFGSMAYGMFTGGRVWPGGWPFWHVPGGGGGRSAGGQTTTVRTEWLEVELDHDTGAMRGRVLKGAHTGTTLDRMPADAVIALYREASATDPESGRLLEAYLDRTVGADWRSRASSGNSGSSQSRSRSDSGMSREEAYRVLGLAPGAGEEEIRAAHRKLILQIHPDRGGTSYLAAKINEAKDVLLGN
jgi:hypothetical protein